MPLSYTSNPPSLKSLSYFFIVVIVLRMTGLTEGTEISPDLASFNYSRQCLLKWLGNSQFLEATFFYFKERVMCEHKETRKVPHSLTL